MMELSRLGESGYRAKKAKKSKKTSVVCITARLCNSPFCQALAEPVAPNSFYWTEHWPGILLGQARGIVNFATVKLVPLGFCRNNKLGVSHFVRAAWIWTLDRAESGWRRTGAKSVTPGIWNFGGVACDVVGVA